MSLAAMLKKPQMISTEEVGQSGTLAMVLVRRCNSVQVDHKTVVIQTEVLMEHRLGSGNRMLMKLLRGSPHNGN